MAERIRRRSGGLWPFTAYVVFFAWLDWITHRSAVFVVVVGGGLIAAAVFRDRLFAAVSGAARRDSPEWVAKAVRAWGSLPGKTRLLVTSLTPLLYFLLRGQGTSGAGLTVLLASGLVACAVIYAGPAVDRRLRAFYAVRDRVLVRPVRLALAPVLGVLIAFTVVHGSLADLPALFGGTTSTPQSPVGMQARFFLATVLAGACAVLLLREGEESR